MHVPPNLFSDLPATLLEELARTLLSTTSFRVEQIVSQGHVSPADFWYDQDMHEWVLLVSGAAGLRFEGEEAFELTPGSHVNIPAHRRHRVEWTAPDQKTVWLVIHYSL